MIQILILSTTVIFALFLFFDRLPWSMVLCGLFAQLSHGLIMNSFPYVQFTSIPFMASCVMLVVNHWLAFSYFSSNWYQFSEVRKEPLQKTQNYSRFLTEIHVIDRYWRILHCVFGLFHLLYLFRCLQTTTYFQQ